MLSLTKKTLETKHHNKQIYTYNLNCLLQLGQLDGVHYKVNTFINSNLSLYINSLLQRVTNMLPYINDFKLFQKICYTC